MPEDGLSPERGRCNACGQTIPASAKLIAAKTKRAHARLLGIPIGDGGPDDEMPFTLCLNCRIHLAKLTR